jgi:hypothetical protein
MLQRPRRWQAHSAADSAPTVNHMQSAHYNAHSSTTHQEAVVPSWSLLRVSTIQEKVRQSAAAQLHHLCTLIALDKGRGGLVRPLLRLLTDPSPTVLLRLLPNLGVVVTSLAPTGPVAAEIYAAVTAADGSFGRNWRLTLALASTATTLAAALPPDAAFESLVPILFRYLTSGPAVVGDPAASGLVAVLRQLKKEKQRTEVRPHMPNAACSLRIRAMCNACPTLPIKYARTFTITMLLILHEMCVCAEHHQPVQASSYADQR